MATTLKPLSVSTPLGTPFVSPRTVTSSVPPPSSASTIDPFFGRALSSVEVAYVRDFSGWSVSRLEKEPRLLSSEIAALQKEIEDLSLRNYPTFLQTNRLFQHTEVCLKEVDRKMEEVHQSVLPNLQDRCKTFTERSTNIMSQIEGHRNMVKQQNFLLELLEIPTLMDTCFKSATAPTTSEREKNKLINGALQLDQYVKELIEQQARNARKHANDTTQGGDAQAVPAILTSIQGEMALLKRNIVNHLLTQLRGNISATTEEEDVEPTAGTPSAAGTPRTKPNMITIPEVVVGIRIVGLLKRTMEMFGSGGSDDSPHQHILLKYQFLHSRNAFFENVIGALHAPTLPTNIHAHSSSPSNTSSSSGTSSALTAAPVTSTAASSSSGAPFNLQVFKYLDELISLHRTHLFNITTLYSALFLDHDDVSSGVGVGSSSSLASAGVDGGVDSGAVSAAEKQAEDIGILSRWIHRRMEILFSTLDAYLPHLVDGSSLSALLNSSMSCAGGLSRSKVELDFRPMLVPMFERHILHLWDRSVASAVQSLDAAMRDYAWHMPEASLRRVGLQMPKQPTTINTEITRHLQGVMEFPPLAIVANGILHATNELGKCAPLSIAQSIGHAAEKQLEQAVQKVKNTQVHTSTVAGTHATTSHSTSEDPNANSNIHKDGNAPTAADPIVQLAHGVHDHLLPLVDGLLKHVYPGMTGLLNLSRLQSSLDVLFEEERLEAARKVEQQQAAAEKKKAEEAAAAAAAATTATTTSHELHGVPSNEHVAAAAAAGADSTDLADQPSESTDIDPSEVAADDDDAGRQDADIDIELPTEDNVQHNQQNEEP